MIIRSDHVAGIAFFLFGVLVFLLGTDLPFGSVSAPGAGMMPKMMAALMMLFAILTFIGAGDSPELTSIDWSDRGHAGMLVLITAVAVAVYRPLGFLITMSALVCALLVIVERRSILPAAAYGIGLTVSAYWLFSKALKAPLERGVLWF